MNQDDDVWKIFRPTDGCECSRRVLFGESIHLAIVCERRSKPMSKKSFIKSSLKNFFSLARTRVFLFLFSDEVPNVHYNNSMNVLPPSSFLSFSFLILINVGSLSRQLLGAMYSMVARISNNLKYRMNSIVREYQESASFFSHFRKRLTCSPIFTHFSLKNLPVSIEVNW